MTFNILISTTNYSIFVDLEKTTLEEYIICLNQQYPEVHSFFREDKSE